MYPWFGVLVATLGSAATPLLHRSVHRWSTAPSRPPRDRCESCGAPLGRAPWTLRCRACGARHRVPTVLLATTGAAGCGLLAARVGPTPPLAVGLPLCYAAAALTTIDLTCRRLPDRLLLVTATVTATSMTTVSLTCHRPADLARALLGALLLGGGHLFLVVARPGALGLGDAKLAGLTGGVAAWWGWHTWLDAVVIGLGLGSATAALLLACGQARRDSRLAYGPFLIAGTVLAVMRAPTHSIIL